MSHPWQLRDFSPFFSFFSLSLMFKIIYRQSAHQNYWNIPRSPNVMWDASSRWSFGPISAWDSAKTTTIGRTHPSLGGPTRADWPERGILTAEAIQHLRCYICYNHNSHETRSYFSAKKEKLCFVCL